MFKLVCVVSERDTESRSFAYLLFFHEVSLVQNFGGDRFGLGMVVPRSTHELFGADLRCDLGRKGRIFWTVIVHCICWSRWLDRNRRVFSNLEESLMSVRTTVSIYIDSKAYRV